MQKTANRTVGFIVTFILLLSFILPGCQKAPVITESGGLTTSATTQESIAATTDTTEPPAENEKVLRVLMEEDSKFNPKVTLQILQFQQAHPGVKIELQILPNGDKNPDSNSYKEQRQNMLQQLRVEVMAGKGPDIYILPTGGTMGNTLFEDVNFAMRNGLFTDISAYYDEDTSLGKEALNAGVMDAGILEDKRYVLPLRYDIPVAYIDVAQFEALGGNMSMFEGGVPDLLKAVLASGSKELMAGVHISDAAMHDFSMNFFGDILDYDAMEVSLSTKILAEFLQSVQAVRAATQVHADDWAQLVNYSSPKDLSWLFQELDFWTNHSCMYIGGLSDLMDNTAYAKSQNMEIAVIPIPSIDGSIVADVTFYGAVGGGCDDPALAYEFLRGFLTEQQQLAFNDELAYRYLGWPVRTEGDYSPMWRTRTSRLQGSLFDDSQFTDEQNARHKELRNQIIGETTISREDLPILDTVIDRAEFTLSWEAYFADQIIYGLNDSVTSAAVDADIEELAADFIDELEWHLAEG